MGHFIQVDDKQLQQQFKDHISHFQQWIEKVHASECMLYPENLGESLSIDETVLSNGERYTILTNKTAKGRKGSIVAMIKGARAEDIIALLSQLSEKFRRYGRQNATCKKEVLSEIRPGYDRFCVQKLAYDALQKVRI